MTHIHQKCDFCNQRATYDGKTILGPWANMCDMHFDRYCVKVDGLFNKLLTMPAPTKECYLCQESKPISDFYRYTDSRGVERFRNECKECNLSERKRLSFKKKG